MKAADHDVVRRPDVPGPARRRGDRLRWAQPRRRAARACRERAYRSPPHVARPWHRLAPQAPNLALGRFNGLEEIYTWTQAGNAPMRRLNEDLGYVTTRNSITVSRTRPPIT